MIVQVILNVWLLLLTSKKEKDQNHDQRVTKVQESRSCSSDGEFGVKEMDRV